MKEKTTTEFNLIFNGLAALDFKLLTREFMEE